jgi:hypothetical protein
VARASGGLVRSVVYETFSQVGHGGGDAAGKWQPPRCCQPAGHRHQRPNDHKWYLRKETMLTSGKIVGFVPTRDYDKARGFYENQLGFEFVSLDQYALVMKRWRHKIRITKIPNFTPL